LFNPHRWRLTTYETDVPDDPVQLADEDGCDGTDAVCEGADPDVETYLVEIEEDIVVVYL